MRRGQESDTNSRLHRPSAANGDRPTISVVVPAYNRATTIVRALESVLRQSWTDLEIVVVDDGSTDETLTAAARIADPRIRLIKNPSNLGAAQARNVGVSEARGAWIAFQDSDDEWLPCKLAKQMDCALAPGADDVAVYCGMIVIGEPAHLDPLQPRAIPAMRYIPDPQQTKVSGDLAVSLLSTSLISTQTLVVRTDILRAIGGFDASLRSLEDWDLAIRLAQMGRIACIDEPLVLQHLSVTGATFDRGRMLEAQIRIADKHDALLASRPDIHAMHHYTIAGGHRRAGDFAAARRSLSRARSLQPRNTRYWAMSAYVAALAMSRRSGETRMRTLDPH